LMASVPAGPPPTMTWCVVIINSDVEDGKRIRRYDLFRDGPQFRFRGRLLQLASFAHEKRPTVSPASVEIARYDWRSNRYRLFLFFGLIKRGWLCTTRESLFAMCTILGTKRESLCTTRALYFMTGVGFPLMIPGSWGESTQCPLRGAALPIQ